MTTAEIDRRLYSELLAKTLPAVIRSEAQNERYARQLEEMAERWDELSRGEQELAKLLTLLIEDFEERNYRLAPAKPAEILKHLMEARGLKQRDLADVFGSRSIVSEVLSGKRRPDGESHPATESALQNLPGRVSRVPTFPTGQC
jgi:HTH-type transcriptional regulator / antitoxin HigA